jgi:hypothetical protein
MASSSRVNIAARHVRDAVMFEVDADLSAATEIEHVVYHVDPEAEFPRALAKATVAGAAGGGRLAPGRVSGNASVEHRDVSYSRRWPACSAPTPVHIGHLDGAALYFPLGPSRRAVSFSKGAVYDVG